MPNMQHLRPFHVRVETPEQSWRLQAEQEIRSRARPSLSIFIWLGPTSAILHSTTTLHSENSMQPSDEEVSSTVTGTGQHQEIRPWL
ncbi:hypothetical protein BDZ85DRAFT_258955 [Elsinoe ampelina]|uniref:Uncharacterized protein n=1 Tax=Elsinoe ampelina TaxID=302913 RepID=A0A6A6GG74_9PEZI|nr:hypothetical protein BDZ85DRAFT_258955 [Elsinoe ampelina]